MEFMLKTNKKQLVTICGIYENLTPVQGGVTYSMGSEANPVGGNKGLVSSWDSWAYKPSYLSSTSSTARVLHVHINTSLDWKGQEQKANQLM